MEANHQKKKLFVCKYCHKRYPCGKSLGGHIRTHMNHNHNGNGNHHHHHNSAVEAEDDEVIKLNIDKIFSGSGRKKDSSGGIESGGTGYGLRENPKRTRRFVDSSKTLALHSMTMACKECGKGFHSLKALSGHMASHSPDQKEMKIPGLDDGDDLVMDSESDTETSSRSLLRRSSSKRMVACSSSVVSEIEQEQQEEVAMSLMMLSRDSSAYGYTKKAGGGLNSFADSSDNNSVVLEAKSSSIGVNCVSNVEMMKSKLKSAKIDHDGDDVSDNSDSGYFENGPKKAESDGSVDGFRRCAGIFKKSGFGAKLGKTSRSGEFGKDFFRDSSTTTKYDSSSRKRARNDSEFFNIESSHKRSKFECLTCNKVFHSHRSLWGHSASHSKINGYCESMNESGENSIETDLFPIPIRTSNKVTTIKSGKTPVEQNVGEKKPMSKKSKGHECPFCFRVFKSGQALGGHKRSHFVGGGADHDKTMVIKQDLDEMSGLIDLNLPAPIEEEESRFLQW